ncbi:MAG: phospholipid carrier-dependent glycosyltransferase, partial [Gemmatimonadetes bacterium]|nr:phospholipid carrier-dependent glycosyltransferase [Gemmatimonadota bacterium]
MSSEQGHISSMHTAGHQVWYVLGLALFLRLLFFQPFYLPPDALDYLNAWDAFAEGQLRGLIRFVRLGMMLPLGFLRWISGDSHFINYLYPLAASLGTVWLSYRMAWRWGGASAALLAGGLMAIVPMEVVYGAVLLPDVPLTFFALLACYFSFRAAEQELGRNWLFFLAGLFIGLAYTCKVTALFFAPPAIVQVFFFQRKVRHALFLVAGGVLVLCLEIFGLWALLGEWHLRIADTLGYALGDKGNYVKVDQTWGWWLGQIRFKLGALFWGAHLPTTALLMAMPHLAVVALWRARKV